MDSLKFYFTLGCFLNFLDDEMPQLNGKKVLVMGKEKVFTYDNNIDSMVFALDCISGFHYLKSKNRKKLPGFLERQVRQ